jgi:hypothetical protein
MGRSLVAWSLRGFDVPGSVVGARPDAFCALQKARKGIEFNDLTLRLASFWQFSSSKVE